MTLTCAVISPRMTRGRRVSVAVTSLAAVLAIAGCGSSSSSSTKANVSTATGSAAAAQNGSVDQTARSLLPSSVKTSGVLTTAVNVPDPPTEFSKGSGYQGLDIDLSNAIAAKLGLKAKFQEYPFTELLPALSTGRVDMVLATMTDETSRQNVASFVEYYKDGSQMFTTSANASKYKTFESLCGQTIAVPAGTNLPAQITQLSKLVCTGKASMKQLESGTSPAELELALKTGRAQAAVYAPAVVATLGSSYPELGPDFAPVVDGIAIKAGNTAMLGAVKAALAVLLKDGIYNKIFAKWKQQKSEVSQVQVNAPLSGKIVPGGAGT